MTRPKTTATRQFAGLVLAPIAAERQGTLSALLAEVGRQTTASMQGHGPQKPILPFSALDTVHYARFVLLDEAGEAARWLAFCTDYDGPEGDSLCSESVAWEHHLDDLLAHASEGLEQIFACCEGYRAGKLRRYLVDHRRRASTFFVGASGRSKKQILWEAKLRKKVEQLLDTRAVRRAGPELVREQVLAELKREGEEIPEFPTQPDLSRAETWFWVRAGALAVGGIGSFLAAAAVLSGPAAPTVLAVALSSLVVGASLLVLRFRHLEQTDPQFQPEYSVPAHQRFQTASTNENQLLQNQLTHVVCVKPGPLRWLLIRGVFRVLQVLATNVYNKGRLGDIPSIHFARWSLIPGRQALFFSNFDSSWQSYLGDFIDRASGGLTAVWSNTVDYPRTRWLLTAGSRDASRFLSWARHHQRPTQVWYCAYPGLSIVNINDNTEIRRGLADRAAVDAASWLFRLRAVDRVRTDRLFGEEQTRDPSLPLVDIQGLILWGYGHLPEARYLLLRVTEPVSDALLRWIGELPLNSAAYDSLLDTPREPVLNIAFTHQGLRALGVDERLCARFSTAFFQNSDHPYRTRVNGDVGASAPDQWEWGSSANPVHLALLVYATEHNIAELSRQLIDEARAHGLVLVKELEGRTLKDRKEHFGFRDGIAQPTVQGSGRAELEGNTVAAGEFLLGHRDGYGNVTHSPSSDSGFNVGLNGSYLVLRQLEQNVEAFWSYCDARAPGNAVALASKMVGRWPSGAPLVRHPDKDPEHPSFADEDNFSYIANDEDNDRYGARCPFGSHVRRVNPRDWGLDDSRDKSRELANLHRILRRGRPYGEPLDAELALGRMIEAARRAGSASGSSGNGHGNGREHANGNGPKGSANGANGSGAARRGLQFLCFNSNIERQFEFIQQQWCNNPKFAGLVNDPDPLLGLQSPPETLGLDGVGFTLQSDARRAVESRCNELQRFVTVLGSSYFFMPSIPAVRLLGAGLLESRTQGLGSAQSVEQLERQPEDEQLHIDRLIQDIGDKLKRDYVCGKTLRDGHPKMHGCLRATFRIEPNLPRELAVGLFARAKTYAAWIRFSNESGSVSADNAPDVRGAAIKLVGVDGFKLLEGNEGCQTHDFILTTRPGFVAKSAAEFSGLMKAFCRGGAALVAYFATHPRVAARVLKARQKHAALLELEYFSGVPYLLGTRAVKYSIAPSVANALESAELLRAQGSVGSGHDFLREGLKKALAGRSVVFDFKVQVRPDGASIEDSTVVWSRSKAEFRKVATLELLQQDFDTPTRQEFGENLSFNPWRCLPEHRPLGGINRARRQVYRALSALRHARNAAEVQEPRDDADRPGAMPAHEIIGARHAGADERRERVEV